MKKKSFRKGNPMQISTPIINVPTKEQEKMLQQTFVNNYSFARNVFAIMPFELSFEDKIRSIKENLIFKKKNSLQFSQFQQKGHSVLMSKDRRDDESPMQYEIKNPKGERIAVFNFFLVSEKDNLSVRINNHRGLSGKKYLIQLNNLNKKIGEDWRALLLKTIKNYFEKRNIKTIAEMPRRFTSTSAEYLRYSKYYFNTAVNAGISLENIDFRYVPDKNLKNLFIAKKNIIHEANLKLDKKRLKEAKTKHNELKKVSAFLKRRL